jgi:hypothetical protein
MNGSVTWILVPQSDERMDYALEGNSDEPGAECILFVNTDSVKPLTAVPNSAVDVEAAPVIVFEDSPASGSEAQRAKFLQLLREKGARLRVFIHFGDANLAQLDNAEIQRLWKEGWSTVNADVFPFSRRSDSRPDWSGRIQDIGDKLISLRRKPSPGELTNICDILEKAWTEAETYYNEQKFVEELVKLFFPIYVDLQNAVDSWDDVNRVRSEVASGNTRAAVELDRRERELQNVRTDVCEHLNDFRVNDLMEISTGRSGGKLSLPWTGRKYLERIGAGGFEDAFESVRDGKLEDLSGVRNFLSIFRTVADAYTAELGLS